jgi:5-methylcytosine-specific restriction protein A
MTTDWSDEELRESVRAYLTMLVAQREGRTINKANVYRDLASAFPARTPKAFEYRMQNISYVLSLLGRPWLKGAAPAKNVGSNVATKIESLIGDLEGKPSAPTVALEIETRQRLKAPMTTPPTGEKRPESVTSSVTAYRRDPAVRAWVLRRANGVCECCDAPAPFADSSGAPYLEVHHVRQLADGGSDQISNTVALCPNCHRRLHFGADAAELSAALYERVSELVPESKG